MEPANYKEMRDMFKEYEKNTNGNLNFLRTCILDQQKQIETLQQEIETLKRKEIIYG